MTLEETQAKLEKLKNQKANLEEHLESAPRDYEAVIKSLILNSDILQLEKELDILNYQAEIDKYR